MVLGSRAKDGNRFLNVMPRTKNKFRDMGLGLKPNQRVGLPWLS